MADFDAAAAKAAGYSDDDIARVTKGIAAARAVGYSDEEIRTHLSGGATASAKPPSSPPTELSGVSPNVGSSEAAGALQGAAAPWATSRILSDLGHYPAMGLQAAANGVTGMLNFPAAAGDFINRYTAPIVPKVLSTPVNELPAYFRGEKTSLDTGDLPRLPEADLGAIAQPNNSVEALGAAGVGGLTAALTGGTITRLPALLHAGAHDVVGEIPRLLHEGVTGGAIPAVVAEAANQNIDPVKNLSPDARTAVDALIGAAAAVTAKHYAGGNPIESVAAKLGSSQNADEAGDAAKSGAQEWRKGLGDKLEALKGKVFGQVPEADDDATHDTLLFGKVPLHGTTIDNSEMLRTTHALAGEGGVYSDFYHNFVSKLPEGAQTLFDRIALSNSPIEAFPPRRAGAPGMQTYRDGAVPGENNTYGPYVDGEAIRPPQGPGGVGGWEVPRGGRSEAPVGGPSAPSATGARGPEVALHTTPEVDTGYRPNWQFGVNNPPGEAPQEPPPSSPILQPAKRNARGHFVSKGYGVEPYEAPGTPQSTRGSESPSGSQETPSASSGEVAPHIPEPVNPSPGLAPAEGTTIGFRAPLADAMKLRSTIGEWLSNPRLMPKGIDESHAKAYYAALSADIGNTMDTYNARPEWDDYNTKATSLYAAGNMLSKFAKDTNPERDDTAGGKAVDAVWRGMRKDSGEIANLREQVPQVADEVAAAFLRSSPEKWNTLPPATQRALVPNPFDRLALNASAVKKPDLVTETSRNREPLISGGLGYGIADLLEPHGNAQGSTSLMSPAAWSALAMAAPPLVRFGGRVRENPRMLNTPIIGGVAATSGAKRSSPLVASPTETP